MHDVFASRWRRAVLACLQHSDDPVAVRDLARQLDEPGGEARSVRTHVLEMADFGILGYDSRADTVWIPEDVAVAVAGRRSLPTAGRGGLRARD